MAKNNKIHPVQIEDAYPYNIIKKMLETYPMEIEERDWYTVDPNEVIDACHELDDIAQYILYRIFHDGCSMRSLAKEYGLSTQSIANNRNKAFEIIYQNNEDLFFNREKDTAWMQLAERQDHYLERLHGLFEVGYDDCIQVLTYPKHDDAAAMLKVGWITKAFEMMTEECEAAYSNTHNEYLRVQKRDTSDRYWI